jgi:hypothetical protein
MTSTTYVCLYCGETIPHVCPGRFLLKVEEKSTAKTRAADDAETISKRLKELAKEREEVQNKKKED